jgi:hypothetical protein
LVGSASPQVYDLRVSRGPLDPERIAKFASCIAWGLVEELCEDSGSRIGSDDLTALMCISAWMNRSGAELCDSLQAMLRLRTAIVRAAGMDERTEPVPLLPGDPKVAALNLARYLEDLMRRASLCGDLATEDVADRALELVVA